MRLRRIRRVRKRGAVPIFDVTGSGGEKKRVCGEEIACVALAPSNGHDAATRRSLNQEEASGNSMVKDEVCEASETERRMWNCIQDRKTGNNGLRDREDWA